MRLARALFFCFSLCLSAEAQPAPAADDAVESLIHRYLAKIAAPTLYSSLFEIPQDYTPGEEVDVLLVRWDDEAAACVDELRSGWVWLIRPGPRLDLIDNERWAPESQRENCATFLDDERRIRRRRTYDEQDRRIRAKQGLPEPFRESEFLREPRPFRNLTFRWTLPSRAHPETAQASQPPSTLSEVKQEIQRIATKRRDNCGPGEALIPRFEDDDPALIVFVQAGQGCDDFVIDIIPDLEGRLTLGAVSSDWDMRSVHALVESMLLERAPLP